MSKQDPKELEARLLASVARVRPLAEARARDADHAATLHPEVVAAMRDEGLFSFVAPVEVGGDGAQGATQLAVFEAMAHAEPSAGWSLMIGSVTTAMMGAYLPEAATKHIFSGPMPIAAGLRVPTGTARRVPGGYEVSGRWAFGSGVRHADWVFTPAVVEGVSENGMPVIIDIAVPAARVTIEDTWDTAFLRGSGSAHYRMEAVFVEEAFTCSAPASSKRRGGVCLGLPLIALVAPAHMGFALGVARRALEEITAIAPKRLRAWTGEMLANQSSFRADLGKKAITLEAARALAREVIAMAEGTLARGAQLGPKEWADVRAATSYVTDVAADATDFAFRAGGSSAIFAGATLERCFRDIHAAAQHIAATDEAYDYVGRVMLGEAPFHPLLLPRPEA